MEKKYNKLVRDNIPNIIEQDNEIPFTRTLSEAEYRIKLQEKLFEECHELISATSRKDIIKESSDVLEIIKSIAELNKISLEEVMEEANQRRLTRGGFSKRIYLEKTITK